MRIEAIHAKKERAINKSEETPEIERENYVIYVSKVYCNMPYSYTEWKDGKRPFK